MGNFINPDWYQVKQYFPKIENGSLMIQESIFDPTIRNPYISLLFLPVGYLSPIIVIFGLVTNFLILIHMGSKSLKVHPSARLFYLFIGVSDLTYNISYGFGIQILMEAMYMWTDKRFWLSSYPKSYTPFLSNSFESTEYLLNGTESFDTNKFSFEVFDGIFWCKLLVFLTFFSALSSTYGVLAFSVERFIAISFPLWVMRFRSTKLSVILLIICVVPPCAILLPLTLIVVSSQPNPTWSYTEFSCTEDPTNPLFLIDVFCGNLFFNILHVVLVLFLVVAILWKIRQASLLRKKSLGPSVAVSASAKPGSALNDLRVSITLLLIATVNIIIFGSSGIFWIFYLSFVDYNASLFAGTISRIMMCVQNISFCSNFLVYIAIIPAFRRSVFSCLPNNVESITKT